MTSYPGRRWPRTQDYTVGPSDTVQAHSGASSQPPATCAIMSSQPTDDSFELYDLRVEVVCPPGERIMCGAKEGDYFSLEGEMMYLPHNQGISIYSLGELGVHDTGHASHAFPGTWVPRYSLQLANMGRSVCSAVAGSKAASDARQ